MDDNLRCEFLRKRMVELREKNGKSQADMARLLGENKSTLSRAENGSSKYKTVLLFAKKYCEEFHMTPLQVEKFLRGDKVIVTDTSALLKNDQLLDELSKEYSWVIVPDIVVDELDSIKDHNTNNLAAKAWRILQSITNHAQDKGGNIITRPYIGNETDINNDQRIIAIAIDASAEFNCEVDIITYDTGFSARLSGMDAPVKALFLLDYLTTKQDLVDMDSLMKLNQYYADSYDDVEEKLGIRIPTSEDINAYLPPVDARDMAGYTLIISAVRNNRASFDQRKEKIRWLISHGADVNKRDNVKYYFPPLSHAIQKNDFDMFMFLLHECKANPNVGSRNPHDSGKIRQKNDGNMPLMIAAWDNKIKYVKELVADERTSLNQQDGNGFTALIKACYWGWLECRDILIEAGADTKIVDRDGFTAEDRYHEYLETGRRKSNNFRKGNNNRKKGNNYGGGRRY